MPDISKITLPSGTTYDIKDATARSQIEALSNYTAYAGVTTSALTDGSTTNPIVVGGNNVTAQTGMICTYQSKEFIWNGSAWQEFGDLSGLGLLAYADQTTATYTPAGSVSSTFTGTEQTNTVSFSTNIQGLSGLPTGAIYTPAGSITGTTFTGASMTSTGTFTPSGSITLSNASGKVTVSPAESGTTTYTPAGSITGTTFTGASMTSTGTFTPSGSVSLTNSNQTATVSPAGSGTATYTPAGNITGTTFTGASMTSTGTFTPSGSVSLTDETAKYTVSPAGSGTATYTPAGNITAGAITVKTAGATSTIHNPTKVTVAKTVVAAAPGATAPSNALTYYSVANETLSLYQLGYTTGDSITTSDVTVKTGDAAYESANPTFSGTGVRLVTSNISIPTSASFSGSEGNVSVSGTTTGSVSNGTFSGTGVRLVTGNISVPSSASFSGTEGNISVSGTTTGSVSNGTFSGTSVHATVTTTPSGSVSSTFTGTEATIISEPTR